MSQLTGEITQEIAILATTKKQVFTSQIDQELWIIGNQTLKRAFRNLLDNSLKFTPVGGSLSLRVYRDEHKIQVEIKDSGVGIPEDELDDIFEPYYRASSSGDRAGTGLGLSVVRNVVTAHRGRIKVKSTEGQGTVFTLTLPAVPPPSKDLKKA